MVNCSGNSPNDPKYVDGTQWYLNAINAPDAWDITKGNSDIKITVIDSRGVPQQNHPDLVNKIVTGGDTQPENDHSTRVAGFAGAATDNGEGIASLGWNTSIITYESTNDDNNRSILAGKIDAAVTAGAKVINLSLKTVKGALPECGPLPKASSPKDIYYYYNWSYGLVEDAIDGAIAQNVVVVASAGNTPEILNYNNYPCEDVPYPCYPAQYDGVIGVSGSYQNGNFVDDWNYGDFVDLNAPGATNASQGLYSTTTGGTYGYDSGTSYSAPMVSALAALIISVNDALTPIEIQSIMENTAEKTDSRYQNSPNEHMGYGRINAYKALKYTLEHYGGTLTSSLNIPSGETWTFQPGVTIKFNSAYSTMIVVNSGGKVIAEGTSANPITFEHASGISYWTAFSINSSGNIFKYCNFKHAGTDLSFSGVSGANTIQNCNFQNYNNAAMYFSNSDYNGSTINLSSCTFQGNGKELQYSGNIKLTNSVNIPSNVTLTVSSGTSVKFNGYYSLAVQSGAKIIANGTQANPIFFTSATGSTPGLWAYVILYGGNNVYKYCTFENSSHGLYLSGCTASEGTYNNIENCTFRNNSSYGFTLSQSVAKVKGCIIYNNSNFGIYCYNNPDIKFTGNRIYQNSSTGVFSSTGNFLEFYGNVIENNSGYGIYTKSADHIHLGNPYVFYGKNTIRENGNTEVYAYVGNPDLDMNRSSIHDDTGLEVYNRPGNSQIHAQSCYFGSDCTPQSSVDIFFQDPGCIPHQYPDGWEDGVWYLDGPFGKKTINRGDNLADNYPEDFIIDPSLSDEAKIELCKKIISDRPKSRDAQDALVVLYSVIRADFVENALSESGSFYTYLSNLNSKYPNSEIGKIALRYMIIWKMLENDDEAVINLSNKALKIFTGEEHNDILGILAITYAHRAELNEAKNVLNELKEKCATGDELIRIVEEDISDVEWRIAEGVWEQDDTSKPLPPPEDQPVSSAPNEFAFSTNYPNPFNAVTTITFSLPEASKVKTEVYDLTGRCVAVLCDRHYSAGTYSVQFDGLALASGIYFLRSRMDSIENPGKSQVFTSKMMLMK